MNFSSLIQRTFMLREPAGYDAENSAASFHLRGKPFPMQLDGQVEEVLRSLTLDDKLVDVRQLSAVLGSPAVTQAEALLDGGARSVEVDLGDLGHWEASRDGEKTRFAQGPLGLVGFTRQGGHVALELGVIPGPDETLTQRIVARANPGGTLTVVSEEIVDTIRSQTGP